MSGFKLYNLKRQAIVEYRRIRIYKKIMEQKKVEKNYKILEKIQNKNTDSHEILYLIFDYPHKHYTFKYFEVQKKLILPRIYHD